MKPGLSLKAFKRLEPYDMKVSRTVLRGRRRRQLLLCYPTLSYRVCLGVLGAVCVTLPLWAQCEISAVDMKAAREFVESLTNAESACSVEQELRADSEVLQDKKTPSVTPDSPQLKIFISTSLSETLLQDLAEQVKTYGGTLILKGFVDRSLKATLKVLGPLVQKDSVGFIIDPREFETHAIDHVPTFVFTDGQHEDRLSGAVTVGYVLEQFSEKGDLKEEAQRILDEKGQSQ